MVLMDSIQFKVRSPESLLAAAPEKRDRHLGFEITFAETPIGAFQISLASTT